MSDPHTERIAFERQIHDMTGASTSEIRRAALGTPLRDFITRVQLSAPGTSSVVTPPPPPKIDVIDQTFEPKPFRIENAGRQSEPGNALNATTTDMYSFIGGQFYKQAVYTSGEPGPI